MQYLIYNMIPWLLKNMIPWLLDPMVARCRWWCNCAAAIAGHCFFDANRSLKFQVAAGRPRGLIPTTGALIMIFHFQSLDRNNFWNYFLNNFWIQAQRWTGIWDVSPSRLKNLQPKLVAFFTGCNASRLNRTTFRKHLPVRSNLIIRNFSKAARLSQISWRAEYL